MTRFCFTGFALGEQFSGLVDLSLSRTTESGGKPPHSKSGAEEDGFALEHLDGDEKGGGGVDARGGEDDGDVVPMIGAGDELFAEQADVEYGDE
jgi:hypothetical protein